MSFQLFRDNIQNNSLFTQVHRYTNGVPPLIDSFQVDYSNGIYVLVTVDVNSFYSVFKFFTNRNKFKYIKYQNPNLAVGHIKLPKIS